MAKKIRVNKNIPTELENRIVMDEVKSFYKWQYLRFLLPAAALLVAALLYHILS